MPPASINLLLLEVLLLPQFRTLMAICASTCKDNKNNTTILLKSLPASKHVQHRQDLKFRILMMLRLVEWQAKALHCI